MVDMYRTLDSIPVLAKAGGILVMTDEIRGTEAEKNPESLKIKVFPGADGNFRLYEDDNETCAYENGACVFTEMDYKEKDQAVFTIHPAQGKTELIPAKRAYTVEFCNFAKTGTDTVKVLVNGAETEAAVKYEEKLQKICVEVAACLLFLKDIRLTWISPFLTLYYLSVPMYHYIGILFWKFIKSFAHTTLYKPIAFIQPDGTVI